MDGMIFDIEHASFVDGPGIRTTVFFKGCNLHCRWCHNPESQSGLPEKLFYADKCSGCGMCKTVCSSPDACTLCGNCADICPNGAKKIVGRRMTADKVLEGIARDAACYRSDGGATFSGGECMLQPAFLHALLAGCRRACIGTAVDTAGAVPWERFEAILPLTDLFLYDIKCMDPQTHRRAVGVDNTLILDNYARLQAAGARVTVRVPVVPGINDSEEEMTALRRFFDTVGAPEQVELLPYHRMGENKYRAMGQEPVCFDIPDKERMDQLQKILG